MSVAGSSGKSESEESRVGELSVEGGTSIDVRLLGGQSIESVSVEESGSELEGPSVSRLPVGSLEVEGDSEGVVLSQVSDFSSLVLGWVSGLGAGSSWNIGELVLNQVDELLVVVNSGSGDEDFFWGNVLELELLEDVAGEISDVALKSLEGETESLESVGGSEDGVVEVLTGLQELVELVGILVLGLSDLGGDDGSWLESAIGDHGENVDDVVGEGGSVEVGLFLVVLHLEVSSGHLDDTVVDGFVGVEDGFQVGVLDGEERSGGFVGLISGSNVQQDTEIDFRGEGGRLSDDGDSVGQFSSLQFGGSDSSGSGLGSSDWSSWVSVGGKEVWISLIILIDKIEEGSSDREALGSLQSQLLQRSREDLG